MKKTDEQHGQYDVDRHKAEQAALKKYAAIQNASEDKIGCQKIYVDIAGGIEEAFILDELIYFTLPRNGGISGLRVWKEGYLWMAVSRTEWWERKRLTPRQADGAIERLVASGVIIKDYFLFNKQRTMHLRLNIPEFFRRYGELLDKENPPENQDDTLSKDIADLYEMMGVPVGDTPNEVSPTGTRYPQRGYSIPNGDKVSPKRDSINTPNTPRTQPENMALPPNAENLPIDWQIASGGEVIQVDDALARRKDFANLLAIGTSKPEVARDIAMSFQMARGITLTEEKVKGQRKAVKEMLAMGVTGEHVSSATQQLIEKNMTVVDLFSVSKTAIDLANKPAVVIEKTRLL